MTASERSVQIRALAALSATVLFAGATLPLTAQSAPGTTLPAGSAGDAALAGPAHAPSTAIGPGVSSPEGSPGVTHLADVPGAVFDRGAASLPLSYPHAARPVRIHTTYSAPAVRYQAGHLGLDLAAATGSAALAPGDGVVSFAGTVVDRGIVVIDHGDVGGRRLRTTLEPVIPAVMAGERVVRGQEVGRVAGPHRSCAPATCLHLGVRLDEEYRDPRAFLGERRRAVLLPAS